MKLWLKAFVVMAMSIAILVPLMMIFGVIQGRKSYREEAVRDIASHVGGAQQLQAPVLVVPYTRTLAKDSLDGKDGNRQSIQRETGYWYFYPETFKAEGILNPSVRKRGLHEVRVYDWQGELTAHFDTPILAHQDGGEYLLGQPFITFGIRDVRGLRGTPQLQINGRTVKIQQGAGLPGQTGMHVALPMVMEGQRLQLQTRLVMTLAGTENFGILPLADSNHIRLKSSWAHPSFSGILPQHDVTPQGFEAHWQIDALATDARRQWQSGNSDGGQDVAKVALLDPVNPYLMAERATKYGVLFVLLTFAGFFMFELVRKTRVHPIQYGLVGLAIAIFFLLLLSLSEHVAFGLAYLLAALACTSLIGFYLSAVLKSLKAGMGFSAMLATLYTALYGLLILEDNALVVGAGLLFLILAAIMIATRKVDWYALGQGE
ncbi:cell envelope integrity protein CreD [Lysobacteraceae bacterium NML120232]|nr:cell envelope integrity protein CreD [Xanthomonadaceae bacterium NML08-0793]PJK13735.1 cell envelope integrity protein CreD [Xanthomonadaceae bacterium NML120232]